MEFSLKRQVSELYLWRVNMQSPERQAVCLTVLVQKRRDKNIVTYKNNFQVKSVQSYFLLY